MRTVTSTAAVAATAAILRRKLNAEYLRDALNAAVAATAAILRRLIYVRRALANFSFEWRSRAISRA
jgi:hypothetical protein